MALPFQRSIEIQMQHITASQRRRYLPQSLLPQLPHHDCTTPAVSSDVFPS